MAASTAEIKAHGILYQGIAVAYDYSGAPICECGHLEKGHDDDEVCQDCDCQHWTPGND